MSEPQLVQPRYPGAAIRNITRASMLHLMLIVSLEVAHRILQIGVSLLVRIENAVGIEDLLDLTKHPKHFLSVHFF